MNRLQLKKGHERRLKTGHQWVFSNELELIPPYEPGSIVEVVSHSGKSFGFGFYNPNSLISVRLLKSEEPPDFEFILDRIQKAISFRSSLIPTNDIQRLVFGESDFLPGLVIDKYDDYLAMQFLSAGMDLGQDIIIDACLEALPQTKGIIAKNNSKLRELEGLEPGEEVLYGEIPDVISCQENGIGLEVNLITGQKTGYFLDQKFNREFISKMSKGLKVLDCYCNQGGFALHAAKGGARKTIGLDSSETAIRSAIRNAEINDFENCEFIQSDVVEYLDTQIQKRKKWDMIILDPPAFTKNKKTVHKAKAAYAKINKKAMQALNRGGYLVSSSCSQHMREDVFTEAIDREAQKTERTLKMIFRGTQSPDHPILLSMPETQYLKFFVFQVV